MPSYLKPWMKLWARRVVLIVNLVLVVHIVVTAEGEGFGLEVAQYWTAVTGILGQAALLRNLLVHSKRTSPNVSVQSLGIITFCNTSRLVGASPWSTDLFEYPIYKILAILASCTLGVAIWCRHVYPEAATDPAFAICGTPFGAELVRRFYLKNNPSGAPSFAINLNCFMCYFTSACEHVILPIGALFLGVGMEGLVEFSSPSGHGSQWWIHSWHQALEAVALLPQLKALLALRSYEGGSEKGGVPVPNELRYWLASSAIGHFFSLFTSIADVIVFHKNGRRALVLASFEGVTTMLLAELLAAHVYAKWHGSTKLILPA